MPKANGQPIISISSFTVSKIGANIDGLNAGAKADLRTTTSFSYKDQAVLNLGIGVNINESTADVPDNQVNLEFVALLTEHPNVTNGSTFWVGAGVVGKPKMVWVGQIAVKPLIYATRKPTLHIITSIVDPEK